MTAQAARRRASACFAVARSATIEGERVAAIARGMAIVERHGLDVNSFDVPGRARARAAPLRGDNVRTATFGMSAADLSEAIGRLRDAMVHAASVAGAMPGETIYDARRRNFDREAQEARQRDARRAQGKNRTA